jgi:hypothetical protein
MAILQRDFYAMNGEDVCTMVNFSTVTKYELIYDDPNVNFVAKLTLLCLLPVDPAD